MESKLFHYRIKFEKARYFYDWAYIKQLTHEFAQICAFYGYTKLKKQVLIVERGTINNENQTAALDRLINAITEYETRQLPPPELKDKKDVIKQVMDFVQIKYKEEPFREEIFKQIKNELIETKEAIKNNKTGITGFDHVFYKIGCSELIDVFNYLKTNKNNELLLQLTGRIDCIIKCIKELN